MDCELRIYVNINNTPHYMGCSGFNSEIYNLKCLNEVMATPFLKLISLFHEIIEEILSYNSDYTKNININTIAKHPFFEIYHMESHGDLLIMNLLLARELEIVVIDFRKISPPNTDHCDSGIIVPAYYYELSPLAEYANNMDLFMILINKFLSKYNIESDGNIEGKYIRFMLHRDHYSKPAYGYGYLRDIDTCLPEQKKILSDCPEDNIPGEMCMLDRGFFSLLKKVRGYPEKSIYQILSRFMNKLI
ncbi:hypothetical protein CE11_00899 [Megavirus courdo11]|uniref:Uncharacterized protein n=1 Tax=Megavirus courdo11 TaxID=1128140 RepID=K7YA23_9VIRU|nr:hypothetical protein CE11_00899 [Megavirus courdo11]